MSLEKDPSPQQSADARLERQMDLHEFWGHVREFIRASSPNRAITPAAFARLLTSDGEYSESGHRQAAALLENLHQAGILEREEKVLNLGQGPDGQEYTTPYYYKKDVLEDLDNEAA